MTHTYLLVAALPSSPAPYWTYLKSPHKIFRHRLYKFLCQSPGSLNRILPNFYNMYSDDYRLLLWNQNCDLLIRFGTPACQICDDRQGDEWRSSSNCGRISAKIVRFNSVNSEIIGRKFTKFLHDVAGLLPFNILKADLLLANMLSNAKAKSKDRSWRCLRTSSKFNLLP